MSETEENPYRPPEVINDSDDFGRCPGWWVARIGVIMYCGPTIGERIGHYRIVGAMNRVARDFGSGDEFYVRFMEISGNIFEENLRWIIGGLVFGFLGAVVVLVALVRKKNRETWFYWGVLVVTLSNCVWLPMIGGVLGVPVVVMFLRRWTEFGARKDLAGIN